MFSGVKKLQRMQRDAEKFADTEQRRPKYPGSLERVYKRLYPKYIANPEHLAPLRELFTRAKSEPVRACVSFPPRGGKTETVISAIVDRLLWKPESRICYVSYGAQFSKKKSARMRMLARQAGVPIDITTRSKQDWATGYGEGGVWATSIGGQITGMGFDLVIIDDALSGWEDAQSPTVRDTAWDTIVSDVLTRLEPDGSIIICGTRWHEDDPIGRAVLAGWPEINVPALSFPDDDETLDAVSYWPARWPTAHLIKLREDLGGENGMAWNALYMGRPRPASDAIFQGVALVDELPRGPMRCCIGVDFAYTVEKSSDYSCAVVLAEIAGAYYVIDVLRAKLPEPEFRAKVKELAELYTAQFIVAAIAATEKPNIELLTHEGLNAFGVPAIKSKKVRALPTAASWNTGRIKVRSERSWTKAFAREVTTFTGADRHDDQVDALASAFDAMYTAAPVDWAYVDAMRDAGPTAFSLHGCN